MFVADIHYAVRILFCLELAYECHLFFGENFVYLTIGGKIVTVRMIFLDKKNEIADAAPVI